MNDKIEVKRQLVTVVGNTISCNVSLLTAGKGPAVLFLHGWIQSGSRWTNVFQRLAGSYCLLAPDLPGFGSSPPIRRHAISLELYADILEHLCDHLSRDHQLHAIVADSLGGILAIKLLQRGVTPSKRLMLSGVPTKGIPFFGMAATNPRISSNILRVIQALPVSIAARVISWASLATVRRIKDVDRIVIEGVLEADPDTAAFLLRDIAKTRLTSLHCIEQMKIMVVRGEVDRIATGKPLQKLASQLGASYHEVKKAGHTPMLEAPEQYVLLVSELLEASLGGNPDGHRSKCFSVS